MRSLVAVSQAIRAERCLEVSLDQQTDGALVGAAQDFVAQRTVVVDAVLVLSVVVLDAHVELPAPAHGLGQVVLDLRVDLRVDVQVGVVAVVVVDHVDDQIRVAERDDVAPRGGDLPDIPAVALAVRPAQIGVELEIVETGNRQVDGRAQQVGVDIVLAEFVGGGRQHILDRAERQVGTADLAE